MHPMQQTLPDCLQLDLNSERPILAVSRA